MSWTILSQDVAPEAGLLGVVGEQVAQEQGRALNVAAGLVGQRQELGVGAGPARQQHSRNRSASAPCNAGVHNHFTARSPRVT